MEDLTFKIIVLYKKQQIITIKAKAKNTQELREKYISMLTGITLQSGITIQVYKLDDEGEWQIVEEHLF